MEDLRGMDGLRDRLQLSLLRRVAELAGDLEDERDAELGELLHDLEARAEEVREAEERLEEFERRLEQAGVSFGPAQEQVERLLGEVEHRDAALADSLERIETLRRRVAEAEARAGELAKLELRAAELAEAEARVRELEEAAASVGAHPDRVREVERLQRDLEDRQARFAKREAELDAVQRV